jgi:SSS family solute:Na+ symporter
VQSSIFISIGAITYVVILIAISVFASRRVRNSADFIVAGRQLPLGLCVFTVFATWFGSGTLIGAAGAAYTGGLRAVVANPFGSALCLLLAGIFYARVLRRLKLLTLPDLFRSRFGRIAEIIASASIIPAYIGWVGSIFVAFGTVLNVVAGVDFTTAIIIGAIITIGYTYWGGMWAVSLTDFFQAIVIIVGLLVLFPLVLGDVGGWQGLVQQAPAEHFRMAPEASFYGWVMFLQALLIIGLGNIASQDLLQRVFSARDERVAQWSLYLSSVLYLTIAMIPVLIGIAGAIVMPDLVDSVFVLPEMGKAYLPPLGMALFAGAMFSALMSSADGGMLAPASIFAQNILKALKSGIEEKTVLRATRYSVVVVGALGLCTALFFQNVYQLMVKSFSILMVGLFVPMTAAIYWKKANEAGAVASMVSGLLSWFAFEYWNLTHAVTPLPSELPAAGIGLIALVIVSLLTSRSNPPKPATDINGEAVDMNDRLGILPLPRPTQQRQ